MEEIKDKITNAPIGVMDSGIGGLTVLKQLVDICPNENYLYFGDTKNLPYGEKTKDELIKIVKEIYDFFEQKKVKAVVMACNTSAAIAYDVLKDNYNFEIYPIIQVVSKCLTQDKNLNKIAIMATQATVNSHKYETELKKSNPNIEVKEQACKLWVPIVEKKLTKYDEKAVFEEYLEPINEFKPQKVILGCTHYPYLIETIAKYAKKELFINPAKIFANYIKADLTAKNLLSTQKDGSIEYFASSNPEQFKENAKIFLDIKKEPQLIEI